MEVQGAQVVSGYTLVRELGRGGMGVVYEGRQGEKRVAIKLLTQALEAEDMLRFEREAEAAARVDGHPNVMRIHGYGRRPRPHIVMPLVTGGSLADELAAARGRPLERGRALEVAKGLASALAHLHQAGVIHRDLKPANILLGDLGEPLVADFGLARVEGCETLTKEGAVMGTPAYMSPEQIQGAGASTRSDLWSLGAIFAELDSGRPAFSGGSPLELMLAITSATPDFGDGEGGPLRSLARRLLDREPACRPTASEVLRDLEQGMSAPPRRLPRRGAAAFILGVASLVLGSLWLLAEARRAPDAASLQRSLRARIAREDAWLEDAVDARLGEWARTLGAPQSPETLGVEGDRARRSELEQALASLPAEDEEARALCVELRARWALRDALSGGSGGPLGAALRAADAGEWRRAADLIRETEPGSSAGVRLKAGILALAGLRTGELEVDDSLLTPPLRHVTDLARLFESARAWSPLLAREGEVESLRQEEEVGELRVCARRFKDEALLGRTLRAYASGFQGEERGQDALAAFVVAITRARASDLLELIAREPEGSPLHAAAREGLSRLAALAKSRIKDVALVDDIVTLALALKEQDPSLSFPPALPRSLVVGWALSVAYEAEQAGKDQDETHFELAHDLATLGQVYEEFLPRKVDAAKARECASSLKEPWKSWWEGVALATPDPMSALRVALDARVPGAVEEEARVEAFRQLSQLVRDAVGESARSSDPPEWLEGDLARLCGLPELALRGAHPEVDSALWKVVNSCVAIPRSWRARLGSHQKLWEQGINGLEEYLRRQSALQPPSHDVGQARETHMKLSPERLLEFGIAARVVRAIYELVWGDRAVARALVEGELLPSPELQRVGGADVLPLYEELLYQAESELAGRLRQAWFQAKGADAERHRAAFDKALEAIRPPEGS